MKSNFSIEAIVAGPKIHIPVRLLAECIANGLKVLNIRIELENHGIYVSGSTIRRRINERYGSLLEARRILLKPVLKSLIKEGGYERRYIDEFFNPEAKTKTFLKYLIPKLFGVSSYTALREQYSLEMMSTIFETGIQDLTYAKINSFLPQFRRGEIKRIIKEEWGGITIAKIQFGREIAIRLFRRGESDEYILKVLGCTEYTISNKGERGRAFKRLFDGMTVDEAREHFTRVYKNVEGHFIWYSDLDNY